MLSSRQQFIDARRQRGSYPNWVLWATLLGMFATNFSFTILAVSLGVIGEELGAPETTMAWVVTGPILFSAITLPILGKLGDLRGHRRAYLWGSLGGAIASVVTGFAWSAGSLIALRVIAGVLGGATQTSSMALIFREFTPRERNRAMGWWSMVGAGAPALGLIAGGPMVDAFGWRVVFFLQAAFAFVALAIAWWVLVETERRDVGLDVPGAVALTFAVGGLMLGLSRAADDGLGSPLVLTALVVGGVGLAAFLRIEQRAHDPLVPLEFFTRRNFTAPLLANVFQGAAYMGAFVLAPFVLLSNFAFSVTSAALFMALRTVSLTLFSPVGGRLGERFGERFTSLLGTAIITFSMFALAFGSYRTSLLAVGAGLVMQGIGHGVCIPPLTTALSSSVSTDDLGLAAAANRLMNQVGVAFGITAMTAAYSGDAGRLPGAFLLGAGISGISVLIAILVNDVEDVAAAGDGVLAGSERAEATP